MERWKEKEDRKFLRAGTIAAAQMNAIAAVDSFLGAKHRQVFTASDFFNLPKPETPKINKFALAKSFFGTHNANVKKFERKKRSA